MSKKKKSISKKSKKNNNSINSIYSGKIITFRKNIEDLIPSESEQIFKLYKKTYETIEKQTGRKYNNQEELFRDYENVIYFTINNIIFGGFILKKNINKFNKISIVFHYGDKYSKQYVYDILAKLLTSVGYMIEASGGVSHILENYYNINPNERDIVENIFGKTNVISWDNDTKTYDRKTKNHIIKNKQLFGRICNKIKTKSWANNIKLSVTFNKGCTFTINEIPLNYYNDIFTNIFTSQAKLNYLSKGFPTYGDLDSESYLSNMVESNVVKINDIINKKFKLSTNGFSFLNIFENDKKNDISVFLNKLKNKMQKNKDYILNDKEDRDIFREQITNFFNSISKDQNIFGKLLDYDISICIDAVPRDTTPNNANALFKGIKLIHTDIYPQANIGDVLWSFKNKWYGKIEKYIKDIEEEDLNLIHNRNKWNNKIVGVYNIWISLTDGITDNGLALLDFNKKKHGYLIPYKAYRPNSKDSTENASFISASVRHNEEDNWYSKFNMQFGDCYIFNTIGTPHSAFQYINGTGKNRKSVELRLVLLKNVIKRN